MVQITQTKKGWP